MSTALTEFERRALTALADLPGLGDTPTRIPAMSAARLFWPTSPVWTGHANTRRGALAMSAGMRLGKLRDRGLVSSYWAGYQYLWTITDAGRKALAE